MAKDKVAIDPFLDPDFHLDLRPDPPQPDLGSALDPTYGPADLENLEDPLAPITESEPEPPKDEPNPDEPEVIAYEDGTKAVIEKKKGVWVATLEVGEGIQPQVFKGKTKEEMFKELMKGQIQATKKIREQNRQIKLGVNVRETDNQPATVSPSPSPAVRELTADEKFELKTALEADPDLAFEKWFQKKFGMDAAQLVSVLNSAVEGRKANAKLAAESESRHFISTHPDYVVCQENLASMFGWLSKQFLGVVLTEKNGLELSAKLEEGGFVTSENLASAYDDLAESGLLILKPKAVQNEPEQEPPVAPSAPVAPQPPDGSRIAKPRGPKLPASYGIQPASSTTARPQSQGVSDDELEDLPLDQLRERMFAALREARKQRFGR